MGPAGATPTAPLASTAGCPGAAMLDSVTTVVVLRRRGLDAGPTLNALPASLAGSPGAAIKDSVTPVVFKMNSPLSVARATGVLPGAKALRTHPTTATAPNAA